MTWSLGSIPNLIQYNYATNRKVAGSRPDEVNFSIYLIYPAAPVLEAEKCFWEVKRGRLSKHCGILNIPQPYRPPWPVKGMAFTL
jgi:hypothetical protein